MSDAEFAAFKCRPGQYYQYGVSDGDQSHAVDWNEYASAANNYAGCFPDMRLPCKLWVLNIIITHDSYINYDSL